MANKRTADDEAPVKPGDVLAGKYRVERVLGAGGMGVVVAATQIDLDRLVALKFVLPAMAQESQSVERFLREARAAVRLRSEHVAKVLDVGRLESGAPYMVMEFLEGADLDALLTKEGRFPVERAAECVLQACEALAEAHAKGLVHRDLKPHNLFLTRGVGDRPVVKVLDFGISKFVSAQERDVALTRTSTVLGSPLYMPPEQMRGARNADARSDIWALGVILYQLLTARLPFEGESVTELALKVATDPPHPIAERRADLPAELQRVIERCLQKDPAARFQDAGALATALVPFAPPYAARIAESARVAMSTKSGPISLPDASGQLALASTEAVQGTNAAWGKSAREPSSPSRARLYAIGAVVVLGGGVIAVLATRGGGSSTTALPETKPRAVQSQTKTVEPAESPSTFGNPATTASVATPGATPTASASTISTSVMAPTATTAKAPPKPSVKSAAPSTSSPAPPPNPPPTPSTTSTGVSSDELPKVR